MTGALSAMEYPHWLVVAGAILMVIGLVGLADHQRRRAEVKRTEMANENKQGLFEFEANFAQTQDNLAERTRDRWANKHHNTTEETLDKVSQLLAKSRNKVPTEHQPASSTILVKIDRRSSWAMMSVCAPSRYCMG